MIAVDTSSFLLITIAAAMAAVTVAILPPALPLVVAITTIATEEGHMRTSTAASLVGAAILSTLIFPFVGTELRRPRQ